MAAILSTICNGMACTGEEEEGAEAKEDVDEDEEGAAEAETT